MMRHEVHIRIDTGNRFARAVDLGVADAFRGVDNLALQIRQVHRVVIHDPQRANPCGGEIHQKRCA